MNSVTIATQFGVFTPKVHYGPLRRHVSFWKGAGSGLMSIALWLGALFPDKAKALDLTAITSPATSATMGQGITYKTARIGTVPGQFEMVIEFANAPAESKFTKWTGQKFFLQSYATDYTENVKSTWAQYANWDVTTPFGYTLSNGAQDGDDNWVHFVAGDQHVWAQFIVPYDSNVPGECVSYVFSNAGDFSLADAVVAKNAGTINYWQGAATGGNWNTSGDWILGTPTQSTVPAAINNGATVTVSSNVQAEHLYVGRTGSGTINVAGETGKLSTGFLQVADSGTGSVNIYDRASVDTFAASIGTQAGASGHVTITGDGSDLEGATLNAVDLYVGESGTGQLDVVNGGGLTSTTEAIVGKNAGSHGTITVDGPSSTADFAKLTVGDSGTGAVIVSAGGSLTTTDEAVLGKAAGAHGELTVTGEDSSADFKKLKVGMAGTGKLSVLAGGTVSTADESESFLIGTGPGSGEVLISGIGSTVSAPHGTVIGSMGTGTLTLQDGGVLETTNIGIAEYVGISGTLNFGAYDLSQATSAGSTTATSITLFGRDGNNPVINFNQNDTNTIAAAISTTGTINQRGSGTTTLTADSSGFYGQTNVTDGVLDVKGKLGGEITVTGGMLVGSGVVDKVTLVDNGASFPTLLAPGDGVNGTGVLTIGDLIYENVVKMQFNITGTNLGEYSQLLATSITETNGILLIDVIFGNGFVPQNGDTFQLFTGALPSVVSVDNRSHLPDGLYWNDTQLSVNGTLSITNSAIPEPGTYALFGLGVVVTVIAYRRQGKPSA